MWDVGVKKFTIFFKIKIYKKTCKKFCRLQKDLYLCSVNKTTKHMINLGYKTTTGYTYREITENQFDKFNNMVLFGVIKSRLIQIDDLFIHVVSRETYRILVCLFDNDVEF